jgi:hypothetical protein
MMDEAVLEKVFPRVSSVFPLNFHSIIAPYHLSPPPEVYDCFNQAAHYHILGL